MTKKTSEALKEVANKGLWLNYRGRKLHTEKDAEELRLIFNSGLSAKQDLITSLGIALLIEENKLNKSNKKLNGDKKMKRIYKCDNCFAYYENKERAKKCHYGDIVIYEIVMNRVKDYHKRKKLNEEK